MENHPIPQDVTGFKFKLIGSISLKEFLYLLGAGILSVLTFVLPISFFIKIPFMFIFGCVGAGLAFVPVEGRPMDKMIYNFFKTVPSENQYIYHKKGVNLANYEFFKPIQAVRPTVQTSQTPNDATAKRTLFYSQLKRSYNIDPDEMAALKQVHSYFDTTDQTNSKPSAPQQTQVAEAQVVQLPTINEQEATPVKPGFPFSEVATSVQRTPQNPEAVVEDSLHPVISVESQAPASSTTEDIHIMNSPQKIHITQQEVTDQKIKEALKTNTPPQPLPQQNTSEQQFQFRQQPIQSTASVVQAASSDQAKLAAGFPSLPDKPNIILGIVRDPRGKVLPNILVEVLDSHGLSVRAFKTNALGQFAAATPLSNGSYTVLFNDPQQKQEFSEAKITLDGTIFQPLEITSIDAREKLRQELFGGKS